MAAKKQGLLKDGTRRRTPATKGGRGGGMPRVMWLAIVVCVAGAVFLFRNQSADVPTGIGENQTIVTAPDVETTLDQEAAPRSGDVDINSQAQTLTPEKSETTTAKTEAKPTESQPVVQQTPKAKPAPKATQPPAEIIKPLDNGPYVAQIGSFGKADNADKEATRLQALGWKAIVRVGNTSDGTIIYRVRIGYFKSRIQAEAFIRQNRKQVRGAIAVHR